MPAVSGFSPRTCCRFIVDRNTVTVYAMLAIVPATTKVENFEFRSNARLTSGQRTRCSTMTNAANTTTEAMNAPNVAADSQPQDGARSKANVNNPIPVVISASPLRSKRRGTVSSEVSGIVLAPMTNETAASGTSIQKTARHPTVWVSNPPTSGPAAFPIRLCRKPIQWHDSTSRREGIGEDADRHRKDEGGAYTLDRPKNDDDGG